ncbi:exo-alpha-sialidase [Streptomyces sp. NPDC054975]
MALIGSVLSTAQSAKAAVVQPVISQPFAANSDGYKCFRIPQLVHTKKALLAIAEARVECGDVGDIDLVARRSLDGGKTWLDLQLIRGTDDDGGFGNPVPVVVNADTGNIVLLYAHNNVVNSERQGRELRMVQTLDGGKTWSPKKAPLPNLNEAATDEGWDWFSVGPGKAVQLPSGRFVVSGEYRRKALAGEAAPAYSGAVFYYSDNGVDWKMGARSEAPTNAAAPTEPSTTLLKDGRIYVNARSTQVCGVRDRRLHATINAEQIADPNARISFALVDKLEGPPVSGSLLTLPDGRLLYSAPTRQGSESNDRFRLAVRTATDPGSAATPSWPASGGVIHELRAGYSDMAQLPDGVVGMLYETATGSPHGFVKFTTFTPQALTDAQEDLRGRFTMDYSANSNNAAVQGDAQLGTAATAKTGKAMLFDGTDDVVRVSCDDSLRLGLDDFTVSVWVKYGPTTPARPILSGYAQDGTASAFGLTANTDGSIKGSIKGRIVTEKRDDKGQIVKDAKGNIIWVLRDVVQEVTTATGLDNSAWHHVVLQRQGAMLMLSVDGGAVSTTDTGTQLPAEEWEVSKPVTGQLLDLRVMPQKNPLERGTDDAPFSIRLGSDRDYRYPFAGAMDEFGIHRKTLTTEELALLRSGETLTDKELIRLSFNTTWNL